MARQDGSMITITMIILIVMLVDDWIEGNYNTDMGAFPPVLLILQNFGVHHSGVRPYAVRTPRGEASGYSVLAALDGLRMRVWGLGAISTAHRSPGEWMCFFPMCCCAACFMQILC